MQRTVTDDRQVDDPTTAQPDLTQVDSSLTGPAALAWLTEMIGQISYMPGFTFSIDTDRWKEPALLVEADLPNAYSAGETVKGHQPYLLSDIPCGDERAFATWLLAQLIVIAMHEPAEWLKMRGARLMDMHDSDDRLLGRALYESINAAAKAGADPIRTVVYAAATAAYSSGALSPEAASHPSCTQAFVQNAPASDGRPVQMII